MKRRIAVSLLLSLALWLPACAEGGGDVSESASEWADAMCEELSTYTASMARVTVSIQGLSTQSNMSVKDKKAEFISLVEQGADTTSTLIDRLETLPTPDVVGGEDAVETFVQQLEKMGDVFADFADRFKEIDTSKPKEAEAEAQAAATEMQDRFVQLQSESSGLTGISPDIDEAINQSERCKVVLGGGSPSP